MNSKIAEIVSLCSKKEDDVPIETSVLSINSESTKNITIFKYNEESLRNACRCGNIGMVKNLYPRVKNWNFEKDAQETPPSSIYYLKLKEQAIEPRLKQKKQSDPLIHIAASNNQLQVLNYLLSNGEDPNQLEQNFFETPLHKACESNHPQIVEFLLSKGANPNIENKFKTLPLTYACRNGNINIIYQLVNHGSNLFHKGNYGDTFLHDAAYEGNYDTVKFLLENGISPHIKNNDGKTPIDYAIEKGHGSVSRLLRGLPEEHITEDSEDDECFGKESDEESVHDEWAEETRSICVMSIDNDSCCSGGGDD